MYSDSPSQPGPTRSGPRADLDTLLESVDRCLRREPDVGAGDVLLLAFSGGPDSTALLLALHHLQRRLDVAIHAVHVDHRLDPASSARAGRARALAARLAVPYRLEILDPERVRAHPGGLEAGARVERYRRLERVATRLDARWILTAHHAGDQAETVALRLLFGSGLTGLGAVAPRRGRILRPLLGLPRRVLHGALGGSGLEPVDDPTNRDPARPRNRVRHDLLPHLEHREPGTAIRLAALAHAARRADDAIARRLFRLLRPRREADGAVAVERRALVALPPAFLPQTLALLFRSAGAEHPPAAAVRRELLRQLDAGGRLGCDCGGGWRLAGDGRVLRLLPTLPPVGDFSYTLTVPGVVAVDELRLSVRLHRGEVAAWMFRHQPNRAALAATLDAGSRVVVRNRRSGDRIRPLGGTGRRRLKDLLIDRRVPRHLRDRLPLLEIDGRIVWVPGVTIDDRCRIRDESSVWIVEIAESLLPSAGYARM